MIPQTHATHKLISLFIQTLIQDATISPKTQSNPMHQFTYVHTCTIFPRIKSMTFQLQSTIITHILVADKSQLVNYIRLSTLLTSRHKNCIHDVTLTKLWDCTILGIICLRT